MTAMSTVNACMCFFIFNVSYAFAGLLAQVCKIRMQSQFHSLMDPAQMQHRKYTNVLQTAFTIAREEGVSALYKGVVPTMLRQGCNQAVNFSVFH